MRYSMACARWLAAPAVLIAIAIYQVYLVRTANLTPWKGGGFGMFSTDQNGANRTVRIYLVNPDHGVLRQLPVAAPRELAALVSDLRQAPTAGAARALARTLAVLPWREPAELEALTAGGPTAMVTQMMAQRDGTASSEQLRKLMTSPRAWVGQLPSTARLDAGRPVVFDHVVVEVWDVRYEADGPTLRARRLLEAASESLPRLAGGGA
jgi:hypothetical protein